MEWISFHDKWPQIGDKVEVLYCHLENIDLVIWNEDDNANMKARRQLTHWKPFTPPVNRRWLPNSGEKYYYISKGRVLEYSWHFDKEELEHRSFLGVYRTEEAASKVIEIVHRVVSELIGGL